MNLKYYNLNKQEQNINKNKLKRSYKTVVNTYIGKTII